MSDKPYAPVYTIAKYVPSLDRWEPRNFGIFVWWKGAIECRFLTPVQAAQIGWTDRENYVRWCDYFAKLIEGGDIADKYNKKTPITDHECMAVLRSKGSDRVLLYGSGQLQEPVKKHELPDVADYLFQQLVSVEGLKRVRYMSRNINPVNEWMSEKLETGESGVYVP